MTKLAPVGVSAISSADVEGNPIPRLAANCSRLTRRAGQAYRHFGLALVDHHRCSAAGDSPRAMHADILQPRSSKATVSTVISEADTPD